MWDYPKSAVHRAAIEAVQPQRDRDAAKSKLAVARLRRQEDAARAIKDREADRIAVLAKTQRLRVARLERQRRSG